MDLKTNKKFDTEKYVKEILKCQRDPFYFITKYCRDYTLPNYPKVKKLHPKQEAIINTFMTDHYVIINGSRQTGKTFAVVLLFSWLTLFFSNYRIALISKKGEATYSLIKEIKDCLTHVNEPFTVEFGTGNTKASDTAKNIESYFALKNSSEVRGITVKADKPEEAGRSMRSGAIFVDEAAFVTDIDEIMRGLESTTNRIFLSYEKIKYPHGIIIASTPNGTTGIGQWYYQQWINAEADRSKYKPIKFHWSEVPDYTEEWFKNKTKGLDTRTIAQEYNLEFLGSTSSFFDDEIIRKLQDPALDVTPKKVHLLLNYNLSVFEPFNPAYTYLIGVDSATAFGSDFSAIEIIEFETSNQVAEFIGKCTVDELCQLVEAVAQLYPNSLIIPETNGLGNQVIEYLSKHNILRSKTFKQPIKDVNTNTIKYKYGLTLTSENRPILLEQIYTIIAEDATKVRSRALKLQLIGLENKNGKIEGQPDDGVFALGFTYLVRAKYPQAISKVKIDNPMSLDVIKELHEQRYSHNDNSESNVYLPPQFQSQNVSTPLLDAFQRIFMSQTLTPEQNDKENK